jgi:hypothetical protein
VSFGVRVGAFAVIAGSKVRLVQRRMFSAGIIILHAVVWIWHFFGRFLRSLSLFLVGVFLVFFIPFIIGIFVISTPRDRAYRNFHPALQICRQGLETGWAVLAESDPKKARAAPTTEQDEWVDPSNDESDAIAKDPIWAKRFRCALQRHLIPNVEEPNGEDHRTLEYYLGFLEYTENGEPYPLVQDGPAGDEPIPEPFLEQLIPEKNTKPPIDQIDVLKQHLSTGSNYVIVFVHGWRHDASLGDQNVADLRLYAAHVARFLADRCKTESLYCDTRVTAIYIGWRGARVNEIAMTKYLGPLGSFIAEFAAGATLFDRKPVSEIVAPGAISALRTLESVLSARDLNGNLKPNWPVNRMIVFGHSLGGNLLATGLKDDLIKAVRNHKPREHLPPALGDLVVLVNPAAEASKWTDVQREVWDRIAYHADQNISIDVVASDHEFFPVDQKPVVVSVTAALSFPAGGLRESDCEWINLNVTDSFTRDREAIKRDLAKNVGMFEEGIEYDWATHDLFPAFKLDFRPFAQWFDRLSAKIQHIPPPRQSCLQVTSPWYRRLASIPFQGAAAFLRTLPFQNTDMMSTRTIGNLDPPRPAFGILAQYLTSAEPFGTTHELIGTMRTGTEKHNAYYTIPTAPIGCSPANNWLQRARLRLADQHGTFWDSDNLAPKNPGAVGEEPPAAQFLHGFNLGGTAAITRANDPFWNMRAFDNALSRHDGYRLSSFICAMNQLVMDDITTWEQSMPNKVTDPTQPQTPLPPKSSE